MVLFRYGLINNRLYDDQDRDHTDEIPELSRHFVNIVGFDDLSGLVRRGSTVVAAATGTHKVRALRVALSTRIANVVITDPGYCTSP